MPTSDRRNPEDPVQADAMVRMARLWSSAAPSLEAFVRTLVRDPNDVDDVIQSTGEYAAREFHHFEEGTSFKSWVITIARFRIHRLWQDKSRDKLLLNIEAMESIAHATVSLSEELSTRQGALQVCIGSLQPRHRKLLEMCYFNNQKPAQIAEQLGQTPNSVSASLMRIRKALRQCIERQLARSDGGEA
ncbi:sigma-70 family RNA polymerase sigma factor [Phycisphaeraceae bacterium D3-23]